MYVCVGEGRACVCRGLYSSIPLSVLPPPTKIFIGSYVYLIIVINIGYTFVVVNDFVLFLEFDSVSVEEELPSQQ